MRTTGVASRYRVHSFALASLFILPLTAGLVSRWWSSATRPAAPPAPTPMPVPSSEEPIDRLAQPILPESPTPVETGRYLYYMHCMPCHGDRGQGLTDEWRQVWVEDHQNCWGRGCHTGRQMAAFFIPRSVPAVSGSAWVLSRFQSADDLFAFLRETQPPQRPGALSDDEYWALTAFLLLESGRLPPSAELSHDVLAQSTPRTDILATATLGIVLGMLVVSWAAKRKRQPL